jgi:hypothetical protein
MTKIRLVSAVLILTAVTAAPAFAQDARAATRDAYAYDQVFTNPQDSTCPNPKHRKVKTSKGNKWRWVC